MPNKKPGILTPYGMYSPQKEGMQSVDEVAPAPNSKPHIGWTGTCPVCNRVSRLQYLGTQHSGYYLKIFNHWKCASCGSYGATEFDITMVKLIVTNPSFNKWDSPDR